MATGGEILNLEDMFSVIRSENLLRDLLKYDCPSFKLSEALPVKLNRRNKLIYDELCIFRKDKPTEYASLYQTMSLLSFVNSNQGATAHVQETVLPKFPELNELVKNYPYDLFSGTTIAAEVAAIAYINAQVNSQAKSAWHMLKDYAATNMFTAFTWGKWLSVETSKRTLAEMIECKDMFEEEYRGYRRIQNPAFDVDVLPMALDKTWRFIIEMTPPVQPVKTDERDPETGHFGVANNKNICSVIVEYDYVSGFVRMTRSKYGDDKFILEKMLKLILDTKIIPISQRRRSLDLFRSRNYQDTVLVSKERADLGDTVKVVSLDISYIDDTHAFTNGPITVHKYPGDNIYDQIDQLLPVSRYPLELRTINTAKVEVGLYHYTDVNGSRIRGGKRQKYAITFTPTSITTSPNIDNPSNVPDREHAKIINDYIKNWKLWGSEMKK